MVWVKQVWLVLSQMEGGTKGIKYLPPLHLFLGPIWRPMFHADTNIPLDFLC